MKKILHRLSFFSVLLIFTINIALVQAAPPGGNPPGGNPQTLTLTNPLQTSGITNPQTFIGKVIAAALGIVGSLALLMFIYGGFTWMTSAGSAEKVTKGKGIMVWAAIGLAVIFSSYALVRFVIDGLAKTT